MDRFDAQYGTVNHDSAAANDDLDANISRPVAASDLIGFAADDPLAPQPGHATLDSPPESLGALLRSLRFEAELSLKQVADAVGVSKPTVWAWENSRAKPTRDKWDAIAATLGVAPHVLTSAAKAERLSKAIGARGSDKGMDRAGLLAAGREMIARAYNVAPHAVRITVEVSL